MRIIFFGSDPWFSPPVLDALERAGHEIFLIVTKGEVLEGRRKIRTIQATKQEDISLHNLDHVLRTVLGVSRTVLSKQEATPVPDVIVLAAFGPPFLDSDVLSWPTYGCLNVHASLLPRWRGASPVFAAIAAGDQETGVSIMKMTEAIDRGSILGQKSIEIQQPNILRPGLFQKGRAFSDTSEGLSSQYDTRESLTKRLGKLGGELIVETLHKLEMNTFSVQDQPQNSPTPYTRRLTKESGRIDWSTSPEEIERFIRAVTPWPGAWTEYKEEGKRLKEKGKKGTLKILKAEIQPLHPSSFILLPSLVQLPGKNPISWKQFIAGHPNARLE